MMPTTPKKSQAKPDFKKVIGRQVKKFRAELRVSQQMLAEECGIFRTYLSRIESGTANPTVTVLAALAASLNVDIRELFAD
jgi:transcriptional regulator with XRE-family HTH domain